MKTFHHHFLFFVVILFYTNTTIAQGSLSAAAKNELTDRKDPLHGIDLSATEASRKQNRIVAITGVRFAYPLVQKWIDDYNKLNPEVQLIIESRGANDPSKYDILIEAYEPDAETKKKRDYVYVARYAILPVANSQSGFSKLYADKGLHAELIKQIFFDDIFSDKKSDDAIKTPFTVYTRLQKAGAPITFANYFGYQQKDIRGKSIAGADEHLLKAVLRDSTGVSFAPLNLIYDLKTGKPIEGLTILPVDLNGNGKVSADEKFYSDLESVVQQFEGKTQKELANVPTEYLNFSIDKRSDNPEATAFLQWIIQHGQEDINAFGFLKPEQKRSEKEKQNELVSKGKK